MSTELPTNQEQETGEREQREYNKGHETRRANKESERDGCLDVWRFSLGLSHSNVREPRLDAKSSFPPHCFTAETSCTSLA